MDAGQIAELRTWGERLARDESHPELRPAGRAILLLVDEVERLRSAPPPEPPDDQAGDAHTEERHPHPKPQRRRPRRRGLFRLVAALGILAALVFSTLALGARLSTPSLNAEGPSRGAGIGPALLPSLRFSVGGSPGVLDRVRWRLDGTDVTDRAHLSKGRLVLEGNSLPDGSHVLTASASGGFPGSRATKRWRFTVDTTGPPIKLDPPGTMIPYGSPIRVAGTIEPGASLIADGHPVLVEDGRFELSWPSRPKGPVTLTATDPLRNATTRRIWISIRPRTPPHPIRAVHVTFNAWADAGLRRGVLDLIAQGRINAVELDLKDESGTVGWNADVPLARRIGAIDPIVDLPAAVALLHRKGVRVIGRLVCFRDPIMANAAWKAGARDEVIQTPDGRRYGGYGGFTNFADPAVRRYQIQIAVEAAKAGVDEILYDYVRRPDGPLSTMAFPGLKVAPEQAIVSFLAETRAALKPYRVFLGASVFGVAATRPKEVAQNVPAMAEHVDYISAMVYPSHWGPGEYGVANPNANPYEIVLRSLEDFQKDVRGTGARVVPWLQDFSLGVDYGPAQVGAEIEAARDAGVDEYLLWDPAVTYTAAALPPDARTAAFPKRQTPAAIAKSMKPDELGVVPVLMHHQIRGDGSKYDMTADQLRAELLRLWRDGFYPVRAIDLAAGRLDVPKGKSPVVLTFDDATNNQVGFLPDGRLDPKTGLGVLESFAASHPGFPRDRDVLRAAQRVRGKRPRVRGNAELAGRARVRARQPHEGPHPAEHPRPDGCPATARPRQPRPHRPAPELPATDDGTSARLASASERARGQRLVAGTGLPLYRRLPRRRRAGAVSVLDEVGSGGDPPHPHQPELGRLARLHRRHVARPAGARSGAALRLRRGSADDQLPESQGRPAGAAVSRRGETVLARRAGERRPAAPGPARTPPRAPAAGSRPP